MLFPPPSEVSAEERTVYRPGRYYWAGIDRQLFLRIFLENDDLLRDCNIVRHSSAKRNALNGQT